MTMNGSATSPEQLMTIFAERAAGGDATGLIELYEPAIELYEPDGVFEPRRTVGAARKPDRRLAIAGAWGAEHLPRSSSWPSMVGPLPFGTQVFRQLIRPVDDPRPVKSSGVPVCVRVAGLHLIEHLLSKAST